MKQKLYYYLLKEGAGKIDPRSLDFIIDKIEEWLPDEEEPRGPTDTYANGWNSYRSEILKSLK